MHRLLHAAGDLAVRAGTDAEVIAEAPVIEVVGAGVAVAGVRRHFVLGIAVRGQQRLAVFLNVVRHIVVGDRSEEHTSELQSLMRSLYAVFRLTNKNTKTGRQYLLLLRA